MATVEILSFKHFGTSHHSSNANPLDIVNRAVRKQYGRSYQFVPVEKLSDKFHIQRWSGFIGAPNPQNPESYWCVDQHVTVSLSLHS